MTSPAVPPESGVLSAPIDETWLVLRAQAGSRPHLERLLADVQRPLYARLERLLGNATDAEDVLQDVLFTLCRRLGGLRDPRLFRPWAYRIASRAAWRFVRRRQRRDERELHLAGADAGSEEPIPPSEVESLLGRATPSSRVVLALHYVEGLTLEEVARELDVSVGTVKSRLAYGLAKLRRDA